MFRETENVLLLIEATHTISEQCPYVRLIGARETKNVVVLSVCLWLGRIGDKRIQWSPGLSWLFGL